MYVEFLHGNKIAKIFPINWTHFQTYQRETEKMANWWINVRRQGNTAQRTCIIITKWNSIPFRLCQNFHFRNLTHLEFDFQIHINASNLCQFVRWCVVAQTFLFCQTLKTKSGFYSDISTPTNRFHIMFERVLYASMPFKRALICCFLQLNKICDLFAK